MGKYVYKTSFLSMALAKKSQVLSSPLPIHSNLHCYFIREML